MSYWSGSKIRDFRSPHHLGEECLVYLIREYKRSGNKQVETALIQALVRRFAKQLNDKLQGLGPELVEQAYQDVVSDLFTYILDLNSDAGDFSQVRFWVFFKARQVNVFNTYDRQIKEAQNTVPWDKVAGYDDGGEGDESEYVQPTERISPVQPEVPQITPEMWDKYREGLNSLPEPQRTAFVLRHWGNWEIESKDPTVPTLSDYFNRSPRTIYYWLEQAEQALENWRGER